MASDYEFDSDLDRQMDHLFEQPASDQFDSDFDRETAPLFPIPAQGAKRKALRSRSQRNKRLRSNQTGSGLRPQMEFELVQQFEPRLLPRFHREITKAHYRLKHNLDQVDLLETGEAIDALFRDFMDPFLTAADPEDQVSVTIGQDKIYDIFVSYKKKNFDVEEFVNRLESVNQSQTGDSFLLSGVLNIEVAITKQAHGGARTGIKNSRTRAPMSVTEMSSVKRSVISINNSDNACGYWAVALAKFRASNPDSKAWDLVRKNKARRLENLARQLCASAGVDYEKEMDRESMKQIDQAIKPEFKLTVVDAADKRNRIFVGESAPKELFVEFFNNHFNTITNIQGYCGAKHFCIPCFKPFSYVGSHRCSNVCSSCFDNCERTDEQMLCNVCHRSFNGPDCLANHERNATCRNRRKCPNCEVEFAGRHQHKCGHVYCDKCKTHSIGAHQCYITPKAHDRLAEEDSQAKFFVSFDIESYQDETSGEQHANLLVSLVVCDKCYDHEAKEKSCISCDECGVGTRVFEGDACVKDFGKYLYTDLAKRAEKKKAKLLVFAHNFGGFDGHFIMKDVLDRDYPVEPVMTGSRILKMDVSNVRFLDTLSLFQQPLAALPKSFGFQDKAVKGHFPHLFNRPENYHKVFPSIPDVSYFAPDDCKTEKDRADLLDWHSQQTGEWIFREEIIRYCKADVTVLMIALMSFRKLFKEITGLDPISRNFTLASIGLEYFRAAFLQEKTLGITPLAGYGLRNQSMIASAWIKWQERKAGRVFAKERKFGPFFADAFDEQTNTVMEFNGCHWHGCLRCIEERDLSFGNGPSAAERYADYLKKKNYYQRHGLNVHEIWECDLNRERASDSQLDSFIDSEMEKGKRLKEVGKARIRESFFGGRTDNVRFFHHVSDGEAIDYKDVTSEYPYVLKFKEYPVGHPSVVTEEFDETLQSYFGFAKVTVLPPRKLHLPVLPQRVDGKLLFPLCTACAATSRQGMCLHSDDERAMTGTWTTAELQKALEKDYKIQQIYEVLHYPKKSGDMFKGYINSWLKIKQEASGWPATCTTEAQKEHYLQQYLEREGIELDRNAIEHNPGKRSIAKLMLNSFWGKLSQRPNLPQVKICREYHEYWTLVEDEDLQITGEFSPNDNTIVVAYQLKDDEKADPGNTSIAIASFVTSYARLHLYKFMERVDTIGHDRLLYFDTDSIIFVRKPGDPVIETGDFLGDLTDELPAGAVCTRFVSGGPKNYGYEVRMPDGTTKTTIKTKGMRHNCRTLSMFNLDVMEDIVRHFTDQTGPRTSREVMLPQTVFRSSWNTHDVCTITSDKRYRVVSNKKWILGNETRPFGF